MDKHYLLDSNIFIQSSLFEYRFSFCHEFWHLLEELHLLDMVYSISSVRKELIQKNDNLSSWVKTLPETFFIQERNDLDTQNGYANLMNWAMQNTQFTNEAKLKFASDHADPWLVAHAAAKGYSIVTHEVYKEYIKKTIKIPNAAQFLGVNYINVYDFLESVATDTFKPRLQ